MIDSLSLHPSHSPTVSGQATDDTKSTEITKTNETIL